MNLKLVLTLGQWSDRTVALGAWSVVLGLFVLDIASMASTHLQMLYLFPLAAMAFHSRDVRPVGWFFGFTVSLQAVILIDFDQSWHILIADTCIALASAMLVLALARLSRSNLQAALLKANTDYLTGLPNRAAFEAALSNELERRRRYGSTFSVAMLDLDGFKQLNDTHGHQKGDRALIVVAKCLRKHLRRVDMLARLGGDEFAVLLPHTDEKTAREVCELLRALIARQFEVQGYRLTVSIGCSTPLTVPPEPQAALKHADELLYVAKLQGRNRVFGAAC